MPTMQQGLFDPSSVPRGGRELTAAEREKYRMTTDLADWRYDSDDDYVVLQLRPDGCDVVTDHTGGPAFLPVLERVVSDRYSSPKVFMQDASTKDGWLKTRAYMVSPPFRQAAGTSVAEALAVTYAVDGAPTGHKMFYVGVIAVKEKSH
ncbi:MAG: hypothetical protein ACHP84_12275 [Caulobacterales bacterium]